ncbi:alpha/beta fold hydrolase [Tomitella biformata]|uniref:alpha/beta fold hydrolase n=1 Tax=Tomitella biformata TaxID=630403 RepID=UPI0004644403|nr:alpha/beta fold hydrolase [Tomitella biformata]
MTSRPRPTAAVLLPGTGSDADFISRALGPLANSLDLQVIAVQPDPGRLVESYLEALAEAAAEHHRLIVGGVSIGAMVAISWACEHQRQVAAVVAALPAWSGEAADSPAAASARYTAGLLRADGLEATIATMRSGSPRWLADELERSWRALWPGLPGSMDAAATHVGPTLAELATLRSPVALVAVEDDPLHPIATAEAWLAALPCARLESVRLADLGADPAVLSVAGLRALAALPR